MGPSEHGAQLREYHGREQYWEGEDGTSVVRNGEASKTSRSQDRQTAVFRGENIGRSRTFSRIDDDDDEYQEEIEEITFVDPGDGTGKRTIRRTIRRNNKVAPASLRDLFYSRSLENSATPLASPGSQLRLFTVDEEQQMGGTKPSQILVQEVPKRESDVAAEGKSGESNNLNAPSQSRNNEQTQDEREAATTPNLDVPSRYMDWYKNDEERKNATNSRNLSDENKLTSSIIALNHRDGFTQSDAQIRDLLREQDGLSITGSDSLRLKKNKFLEKKSLFTIAYDDMHSKHDVIKDQDDNSLSPTKM